jgi:hypothetical protein
VNPHEVLEFRAGPDEEWNAALISWEAKQSLEDVSLGVRVVISRNTPRQGAIKALKDIARMLEQADADAPPYARGLSDLARWFRE